MPVKAVFFDIDGTLLTDNRSVSRSTIRAINELKKQNITVGLATGRDPRFVLQYMASLGLSCAVTYNGQYILSRGEVLFANSLAREEVEAMVHYADEHKKDLSFGTGTGVVGTGIMNFGTSAFAYRVSQLIPTSWARLVNYLFNSWVRPLLPQKEQALDNVPNQPIYQMMLLATEGETRELAQLFPQLSFTRSSPYTLDVLSKGMSKLVGIRKVGQFFGFSMDQVMVFGDGDNDLEMLGGVGYAVAMGNGTKRARKIARHITSSNNKDGIFKALVHFGLISENRPVSKSK